LVCASHRFAVRLELPRFSGECFRVRFHPGFWRKCRYVLRCVRFAVWAVLLAGLLAFAWFNQVGLPNFLKSRLTATLHERGLDLEFSRMRLRPAHGFIAENVRVGGTNDAQATHFTAKEIQLRLDYGSLLHGNLELDGIVLHQGEFTLPATPTNTLVVSALESELHFKPGDTWSLDNFSAQFAGVKFQLTGEIAHARQLKKWPLFAGTKTGDHGDNAARLAQIANMLAKIKFSGQPQFNLTLTGDARDMHTFSVRLNATAPGVQTPWFHATTVQAVAHLTAPAAAVTNNSEAWNFWTNLQPFRLTWALRAENLHSETVNARKAEVSGEWSAPEFSLDKISAQLGGGTLAAGATLDVATRRVTFTNDSTFDLHAVAALLTSKTRDRLAEISWTLPPHIAASGALQLPAWSAGAADWRDDIEPTIALDGAIEFTNASAGGANIDSLQTHFAYSNMMWTLPDLRLAQAGTKINLRGHEDERTKGFSAHVAGTFDAESVRPFLTTSNALRGFSHLEFPVPLALDFDVTGNIRDGARLAATGSIALTNFAIRKQTVDWFTAGVVYSNLTAQFLTPRLARAAGAQQFVADRITLDLAGQRLFITNGDALIDPMVVAQAIGPKTAEGMAPYQFPAVPHTRVNGWVPLKQQFGELVDDDADLYCDILKETPFRWRKFETARILGTVRWWKHFVIVTNALSECYGGSAHGWGNFDVRTEGEGTDFNFFLAGTNVDLHRMGLALWSPTNRLEGALAGEVTITSANSSDWRTWNGFGRGELHDGLLWDVPVIGIVSRALNVVTPGLALGNSRATEADGRFVMTNGVIFTDSLDIRSLTMRLQYVGTVDLAQNVDARAKAQLLRNMPLFGWLVSAALSPVSKIFECRVTGTLGQPKPEPLYVPKLFLAPLHPIQSMEEFFSAPATNAPSGKP
jgi:hypothetical protein